MIPKHRLTSLEMDKVDREGDPLRVEEELYPRYEKEKKEYLQKKYSYLQADHGNQVLPCWETIPAKILGEVGMDPENRMLLIYLYLDLQRKKHVYNQENPMWDYKDMCDIMGFIGSNMRDAFEEFEKHGYDLHKYMDKNTYDKDYQS